MKKKLYLLITIISILVLVGCNNIIDEPLNFKEDSEHDMAMGLTYKFTGKSEHFGFETGKVHYDDNARQLLISNFKEIKKIKNLDYFKLTLSFNNKNLYSTEYEGVEKEEKTLKEFLSSKVIGESGKLGEKDNDGNVIGESDSFLETNKDNFKSSIKIEISYCVKKSCKNETMKISYIDV